MVEELIARLDALLSSCPLAVPPSSAWTFRDLLERLVAHFA
jgi:hypothetical protein